MSIFQESESYRPFKYPWAVAAEKKHRVDMHWHEGQIVMDDDLRQYHTSGGLATAKVSHEQNKAMLRKTLLLFTEMDATVAKGYTELIPYVGNNEIRTLLMTQAAREVTHQRAYAIAGETYGFMDSDWSEFRAYVEMRHKLDVMATSVGELHKPLNWAKKLSVVAAGEAIGLFGAFSSLLNLERFGLQMQFNTINKWSLKDEHEHVDNNLKILKHVREEDLTEEENEELDQWQYKVAMMLRDAELEYLTLANAMGDQEGMTLKDQQAYICYLTDVFLAKAGVLEAGSVGANPLPWMDYLLSAGSHGNFFEQRSAEYTHAKLKGEIDYSKYAKWLAEKNVA